MSRLTKSGSRRLVAASMLALALGACGKKPGAEQQAAQPAASAPQPAATRQAVSAQVVAMGADQLREAADKALGEMRLYAPAGDNAMEYYVALRDKAPTDAAVASALTDLMPYALIATEQSIARDDFTEAQRLYALMEKADPKAPALPRLKQSIADGQASLARRTADAQAQSEEDASRQAELERAREAEQQRAQQQAAQQLATQQAEQTAATQRAAEQHAAEQRTAEQQASDQRAADQRAAERRQAEQPAPASPAPPPAPPAAPVALRPISTPPPDYPPDALRDGRAGEVVVEFTVETDGSVSNPRIVRASPPRMFDRAALNAVRRWRFEPVAAATTTRRTIGFNPGG